MIDIVRDLTNYNATVDVHDPWADPDEARREYGLELTNKPELGAYNAPIITVGHRAFHSRGSNGIRLWLTADGFLYDIKSIFQKGEPITSFRRNGFPESLASVKT